MLTALLESGREPSKAVHEKPEAIYRSHIKDIGNYETL